MKHGGITAWRTTKPEAGEYAPFYRGYIEEAPAGDAVQGLEAQLAEVLDLLRGLPEEKGDYRYAPGKWSVKEVLGHLCDSERVFGYRALSFARGDTAELPGFDEKAWVPAGEFGRRTVAEMAGEFEAVRRASVTLFRSLDDVAASHRGVANRNSVTVSALAWIVLGHTQHHLGVLRSCYGLPASSSGAPAR